MFSGAREASTLTLQEVETRVFISFLCRFPWRGAGRHILRTLHVWNLPGRSDSRVILTDHTDISSHSLWQNNQLSRHGFIKKNCRTLNASALDHPVFSDHHEGFFFYLLVLFPVKKQQLPSTRTGLLSYDNKSLHTSVSVFYTFLHIWSFQLNNSPWRRFPLRWALMAHFLLMCSVLLSCQSFISL